MNLADARPVVLDIAASAASGLPVYYPAPEAHDDAPARWSQPQQTQRPSLFGRCQALLQAQFSSARR
ncbi:hypothetical protein [Rhodopseudomonas palustris]|uniref:Uncharacterized protein n=1 Tax=Rhodopseudomonas palustris TaxID=1076 RepID=A0A418V0R5_RHOPL|nr:hypothetical protein [Rhodopseudomonas palustris]RJF69418.1 hypothetical protein D4Q52_20785 [Rhodopseudomonas palustris]